VARGWGSTIAKLSVQNDNHSTARCLHSLHHALFLLLSQPCENIEFTPIIGGGTTQRGEGKLFQEWLISIFGEKAKALVLEVDTSNYSD